jgi:hypothetical protein
MADYESIAGVRHRLGTTVANALSSSCETTSSENLESVTKLPEACALVSIASNNAFFFCRSLIQECRID